MRFVASGASSKSFQKIACHSVTDGLSESHLYDYQRAMLAKSDVEVVNTTLERLPTALELLKKIFMLLTIFSIKM